MAKIYGTDKSQRLHGTTGADVFYGSSVHNVFIGLGGQDVFYGGRGRAWVDLSWITTGGVSLVLGYDGPQSVGAAGSVTFHDGIDGALLTNFDDSVQDSNFDDTIYAGGGNDLVRAGWGNDALYGEAGNDVLYGGTGNDILSGGSGADKLFGEAGNDELDGGPGDDTLDGGLGNDRMAGGEGDDLIYGGPGADAIDGGGGYNILDYSHSGPLTIDRSDSSGARNTGDAAGDRIADIGKIVLSPFADDYVGTSVSTPVDGGAGDDTLTGSGGLDRLDGGDGNDTLSGLQENDRLDGGAGDDVLIGGTGTDQLIGGAGKDRFVFAAGDSTVAHPDTILDLTHGDRVDVSRIDARTGGPDDAFSATLLSAFSGHAGEIAIFAQGPGIWLVEGDVNGDKVADFAIIVHSQAALVSGDFIL